jgi:hypothetical protein
MAQQDTNKSRSFNLYFRMGLAWHSGSDSRIRYPTCAKTKCSSLTVELRGQATVRKLKRAYISTNEAAPCALHSSTTAQALIIIRTYSPARSPPYHTLLEQTETYRGHHALCSTIYPVLPKAVRRLPRDKGGPGPEACPERERLRVQILGHPGQVRVPRALDRGEVELACGRRVGGLRPWRVTV